MKPKTPLNHPSFGSLDHSDKQFCTNCSRVFSANKVSTIHFTSESHRGEATLCPLCKKRDLYLIMQTNAYMRQMNRACSIQDLLKRFEEDIEIHFQYFKEHFTLEECTRVVKTVSLKDVYRWLEEGVLRIVREKKQAEEVESKGGEIPKGSPLNWRDRKVVKKNKKF